MSPLRVKVGRAVLQLEKTGWKTVKSSWKGFEIYGFRHSATQHFFRRSTKVADIFEDLEPPSKKFLATPLPFSNFPYFISNLLKIFRIHSSPRSVMASMSEQHLLLWAIKVPLAIPVISAYLARNIFTTVIILQWPSRAIT